MTVTDLDVAKIEAKRSYAEAKKSRRADASAETADEDGPSSGALVIAYRSGRVARFPNATSTNVETIVEAIFESDGGFSGVLRLRGEGRVAAINLAEVESIGLEPDKSEDQP